MAVGLKDPCPCGSGKKYKHCHHPLDRKRQKQTSWVVLAAVFVAALAAVVLLLGRNRGGSAPVATTGNATAQTTGTIFPNTGTAASGQTSANQAALPGGRAPQPYEFDPASNRHWDPAHNHWHQGPPPPEGSRSAPGGVSATSSTGSPVQVTTSSTTVTSATASDQSPLPGNVLPQPYQFDAGKNRHWDPSHNHWHNGPPPAQGTTPGATTATPAAPATGTTTAGGR